LAASSLFRSRGSPASLAMSSCEATEVGLGDICFIDFTENEVTTSVRLSNRTWDPFLLQPGFLPNPSLFQRVGIDYPELVVFDLDACLWDQEMYTMSALPGETVTGDLNGTYSALIICFVLS
jgi:hypothetical protein